MKNDAEARALGYIDLDTIKLPEGSTNHDLSLILAVMDEMGPGHHRLDFLMYHAPLDQVEETRKLYKEMMDNEV